MHTVDVVVACLATLALLMALFAHGLRLHWANAPMIALLLGVLIGPEGLGWLDLAEYGDETAILEVVARYTLVIALVVVGIEVRGYLPSHWPSLTILVFGGLVLMWGVSSLLVGWILGIGVLPALLIGAVLAPTDPILSATVSSGRVSRENLPEPLRHLLAAESSARHGLGLLFVLLPALLITKSDAEAWRHWLTDVLLWKGLAAALIGAAGGYIIARALRWSESRDWAEAPTGPLLTLLLALALGLSALVELMESDGAVAVLVAGVVFARVYTGRKLGEVVEHQQREHEHLLKQVLQVPVFVLLGTALPWSAWGHLGWKAPALALAILLLRRIPAVLLLKPIVGQLRRWGEALFVGWFGPVGVGALFFAAVAHKETHNDHIWAVATLLIAVTIIFHDLTATPLSQWLGRRSAEA
jgi:NhaP-type Na+/H+ or K+/H+ antiporter